MEFGPGDHPGPHSGLKTDGEGHLVNLLAHGSRPLCGRLGAHGVPRHQRREMGRGPGIRTRYLRRQQPGQRRYRIDWIGQAGADGSPDSLGLHPGSRGPRPLDFARSWQARSVELGLVESLSHEDGAELSAEKKALKP